MVLVCVELFLEDDGTYGYMSRAAVVRAGWLVVVFRSQPGRLLSMPVFNGGLRRT